MLALLIVGGEVIRPFAIAMAIGIVVGTYSSIFIAAPTLLFLESTRFGGASAAPAQARIERPPLRQPRPGRQSSSPMSDRRETARPKVPRAQAASKGAALRS